MDEKLEGELRGRIKKIIDRYPIRRAALLPVLHLIQDELGWLPPEAVEFASEELSLPPSKVEDTLSFYFMFRGRRPGKHIIGVCSTISCSLSGSREVLEALERVLGIKAGQTTEDGLFSLEKVECLGSCGTAPVLMVDDVYYENMTPEKVAALIEELRRR
jgi:NADH-quinone oxidoreductase E subunit